MSHIHIYNFPYEVSVLINKKFLILLKVKLKTKYKKLKDLYNDIKPKLSFSSFKSIFWSSQKNFRPLKTLIGICHYLDISLNKLEKNILAYRTTQGRTIIFNPKLPIQTNPIFSMLVAHIFGDGNCVKLRGREMYFNYRQYDNEILNLFIKKIERVFGTIKFKKNYFYDLKRIYMPTVLSLILSNYYSLKLKDFLAKKSLPQKMLTHSREHLLAILIAFIIDEGHVESSEIVIGLRSKKIIDSLHKICRKLDYQHSIKKERNKEMHILYILADGVKKFWADYLALKRKYPEVFLGYKEDQIKQFILRKEKTWRTDRQGITKNLLVNLLQKKSRTIKELARLLSISRQGIRFHLKGLEKLGVVKKLGVGKARSDVYGLIKYIQVPVTKKGRSRQYGITAEKITQLLMECGNLDTKQISKKLKMRRSSVFALLKKLEKEGKIVVVGKKVYNTHPANIWALR